MRLASRPLPRLTRIPAIETSGERCLRYRRDLGLPAELVPGTERIVAQCLDGVLGAVIAPVELGEPAVARLAADLVVTHVWSSRMTFLTGPGHQMDIETVGRDLLRCNVWVHAATVVLPSPGDERCGYRRWAVPPRRSSLLPMLAVLEAMVGAIR